MRSLELKNVQRALLSFSRGAARRGREYFLMGRVVSGERIDDDSYRFLVKGSRPEGYIVEITLGEHRWESSCSCPMEFDCKHAYASLLFLEKHGDSQGAVPSLKEQLENRSGFFSLVPKGRDLSETQLDFIKRLEKLYQTHQRPDIVDGF